MHQENMQRGGSRRVVEEAVGNNGCHRVGEQRDGKASLRSSKSSWRRVACHQACAFGD